MSTEQIKNDVKTDLTPLTSAYELLGKEYPPEYVNQLNECIAAIYGITTNKKSTTNGEDDD